MDELKTLASLDHCTLRIQRVRFNGEDELRDWLLGRELDGWLCCTAEVRPWSSSEGSLPRGVPLSGELLLKDPRAGDRIAAHLRHEGSAGWSVWELEEGEGSDHRAEPMRYLSTETGRALLYRRYWERQDEDGIGVWRPFASRFAGWEIK